MKSPSDRVALWRRYASFSQLVNCSVEPVWLPDGRSFAHLQGPPERSSLLRVAMDTGEIAPLVDAPKLRAQVEKELGTSLPFPDSVPFIEFTLRPGGEQLRFTAGGVLFDLELATGQLDRAPMGPQEEIGRRRPRVVRQHFWDSAPPIVELPSPDGRSLLTEQDHNLALRSVFDEHIRAITRDGIDGYAWSLEGAMWSPDARQVVAARMDLREAPTRPIVHYLGHVVEVEHVPVGAMSLAVSSGEIVLIDVITGQRTPLKFGELPVGAPTGWRADGSELLLIARDFQNHQVTLQAADRKTGEVRELLSDEARTNHGTYINMYALAGVVSSPLPDDRLLWLSDHDGWFHLHLLDREGEHLAQLTGGDFDVESVVAVDTERDVVFFYAAPDTTRPYDRHLCRVGLDGSDFRQLTDGKGDHSAVVAPSKDFFLDTTSTVVRPTTVVVRDRDGEVRAEVASLDTGPLDELGWTPPQEFVVKAADGETDLHGVMYLPQDHDPEAKYPIVDVIYQGPQIVAHPTSFAQVSQPTPAGGGVGFGQNAQMLAQLGFVTFVVDGRLTPGRGRAFHEPDIAPGGEPEAEDHLATLEQLAARHSFIDLERAGVSGHSYGGYWALRCALVGGDRYAAAVVGAPSGEEYRRGQMEPRDLPRNAPHPRTMSNLDLIPRLESELFLLHGTSDLNVSVSTSMQIVDALTRAGKDFDLLLAPEVTHSAKGQMALYWHARIARFLVRHLRPAGVTPEDIPLPV